MKFAVITFVLFAQVFGQILDPSFEAGFGGTDWALLSATFTTPLCDSACLEGFTAYDGEFYVWLGGIGTDEIANASQTITIPTTTPILSFYFLCAIDNTAAVDDETIVTVGGTPVFSINQTSCLSSIYNQAWAQVVIDLGALADNGSKLLQITYSHTNNAVLLNAFYDLFALSPRISTSGALTSAAMTSAAMTTGRVTSGAVTSGSVTSAHTSGALTSGAVTSAGLTSAGLTSASLTSGHITTGISLTSGDLTTGVEPEITSGADVTTGDTGVVTTSQLPPATTGEELASSSSGPSLTRGELAAAIVVPIAVVGLGLIIFVLVYRAKSKKGGKDPERGAVEMKSTPKKKAQDSDSESASESSSKSGSSSGSGSGSESESESGSGSGSESGSKSSAASTTASSKSSK